MERYSGTQRKFGKKGNGGRKMGYYAVIFYGGAVIMVVKK